MTIAIISAILLALILFILAAILDVLKKLRESKIEVPAPQIVVQSEPQEIKLDYSGIVEAIKNIKIEVPAPQIPESQAVSQNEPQEIKLDYSGIVEAIKNIKIEVPVPQIPESQAVSQNEPQEIKLDYSEIVEAIRNIKIEVPMPQIPESQNEPQAQINTDILQELATLMRVNQAEFQSGLEAFHKAIDKLIDKIPSGDEEDDGKRELLQKFEDAVIAVQEKANEAMSENSLRMQEILVELLDSKNKFRND